MKAKIILFVLWSFLFLGVIASIDTYSPEITKEIAIKQLEPSDEAAQNMRATNYVVNNSYLVVSSVYTIGLICLFGNDLKRIIKNA